MTEKEFWKCTPKKLSALSNVYARQKAGKDEAETDEGAGTVRKGFIDQCW